MHMKKILKFNFKLKNLRLIITFFLSTASSSAILLGVPQGSTHKRIINSVQSHFKCVCLPWRGDHMIKIFGIVTLSS